VGAVAEARREMGMSMLNRRKAKLRALSQEGIMRKVPLLDKLHVTPESEYLGRGEVVPTEEGRTEKFSYKEIIRVAILKAPQQGGISFTDLRHYDAISVAIDGAENEHMLLEEKDWEFLSNRLLAFRWAQYSRFLLDFVEDVQKAEQVKVAEA
jgi:hypothetical protein